MKISIVCSDPQHPINPWLQSWRERGLSQHQIEICRQPGELLGGDILFLISCHDKIGPAIRNAYRATLVVHAADLPQGRGWSPHIWQIVEGRKEIKVTLLAAEDLIDSGDIWTQQTLQLQGHELADEINQQLFATELALMDFAVAHLQDVRPRPQHGEPTSYYRKRTPEDSRIDPERSIAAQFDLMRVADPQRFPAFFDFRGYRYRIILQKLGETPP